MESQDYSQPSLEKAPVPHLGVAFPSSHRQPWSPKLENDVVFGVKIRCVFKEYVRCALIDAAISFRKGIWFSLIFTAVFTYYTIHASPKYSQQGISFHVLIYMAFTAIVWAVDFLTTFGINTARSWDYYRLAPKVIKVRVTRKGIQTSLKGMESRDWKQIQNLYCVSGDIFVRFRLLPRGFEIPRSTFASQDAARRFYEALYALWKSEGDISTLPYEVGTEFGVKRKKDNAVIDEG